jgi:hypothetical protein
VRTKLILGIAVSLLFCTLAMLEMPEFLTLTDNTSNDFSLGTSQEDAVAVVQAQAPLVPAGPIEKVTHRRAPSFRIRPLNQPPTVDDLLHSLCVQRT